MIDQMKQSSPAVVGFGALELRESIERIAIYWSAVGIAY